MFAHGSGQLQSGKLADASLGRLHLPILMLQGRGHTGGEGVLTACGPQVCPGVPIGMCRLQAAREESNMRRVASNHDPAMLPDSFWDLRPKLRGFLLPGLLENRVLADSPGQGGKGLPEQSELLSMLPPHRLPPSQPHLPDHSPKSLQGTASEHLKCAPWSIQPGYRHQPGWSLFQGLHACPWEVSQPAGQRQLSQHNQRLCGRTPVAASGGAWQPKAPPRGTNCEYCKIQHCAGLRNPKCIPGL